MDKQASTLTDLLGAHLTLFVTLAVVAYLGAYVFYKLVLRYNYFSPHRNLPGPKRQSYLFGNTIGLFRTNPPMKAFDEWRKLYGGVVRFAGFYGSDALLITDPAALTHILLTKSYEYPKPEVTRSTLRMLAGDGVLVAEGDAHRRQKRVLAPAFSQPHATSLTPLFLGKVSQLADIWTALLQKNGASQVIEMTDWMGRLTLDMIGIAGFGYEIDSLYNDDNPLAQGFRSIFSSDPAPDEKSIMFRQILMKIPFLSYLPVKRLVAAKKSMQQMKDESHKIIAARKEDLAQESFRGKDLISVLLKANMKADEKTKLSDYELVSQITTFLIAGSETTATACSWALLYLARHTRVQDKLRSELAGIRQSDGSFSAEAVTGLPYLDAVVREISRIVPSVSGTEREALYDDVVPLSKPTTMKDGTQASFFHIKAGTHIQIAVAELNRRAELYGQDVDVFRPERWLEPLPTTLVADTQGYCAYSHELTFLGGPRACIGRHFAIAELKSILAVLVATFRFDQRSDKPQVVERMDITTAPYLAGQDHVGKQLPLSVTLV